MLPKKHEIHQNFQHHHSQYYVMTAKMPAMLCRGELKLRQRNSGYQTARISGRVISEVVVSHGTDCRGLLLVALEYGDQAQE